MDLEILLTNKHGQPMLGYDPEQNAVVLIPGLATGSGVGGAGGAQPAPYLEGPWTPRLASTGGAEGQAYATQAGRWVKVGGLVWIGGRLVLETRGTLVGEVLLKGLPFPVAGVDAVDIGAIGVAEYAGLAAGTAGLQGVPRATTNAIALVLVHPGPDGASVPLEAGALTDDFAITFGGWYVAA